MEEVKCPHCGEMVPNRFKDCIWCKKEMPSWTCSNCGVTYERSVERCDCYKYRPLVPSENKAEVKTYGKNMIACIKCNDGVSLSEDKCNNCGTPIQNSIMAASLNNQQKMEENTKRHLAVGLFFLSAVLIVLAFIVGSCSIRLLMGA